MWLTYNSYYTFVRSKSYTLILSMVITQNRRENKIAVWGGKSKYNNLGFNEWHYI